MDQRSANSPASTHHAKSIAQAMVEFGLALPILLLVVYGLIETGRLVTIYASVVSAARQAARYGSVSGDNGAGTPYYNDCGGIIATANRFAFLQKFQNISISYDTGPDPSAVGYEQWPGCPLVDTIHPINGDRILVSVSADYTPIVPLVPFGGFTITSTGNRTLLIGVPIAVDVPPIILTPGSGGGGGSGGGYLSITKSASPLSYTAAGQTITYTYKLTNNSTYPASSITLVDNRLGDISAACAIPDPMYGGTSKTCTKTYTTTTSDVGAQRTITNHATFSGNVNGNADSITSLDVSVVFQGTPALVLTKTGTAPDLIPQGALITYEFTFQNTGNIPVSPPYVIHDALIGTTNWDCTQANQKGDIQVGGSVAVPCTGTYALKNMDITNGYVTNTATVSANSDAGDVTSPPASTTVYLPSLLLKVSASPTSVDALGQQITYTYTITNRTSSSVTAPQVVDSRVGTFTCGSSSVASQGSVTCTRTYSSYTQADMNSGYFTSQISASAIGSTGSGNKTYTSNSVSLTVSVVRHAALSLTKTSNAPPLAADSGYSVGQSITYTYTLRNTGNVTLSGPYTLTDSVDNSQIPVNCSGAAPSIAPDASTTCTATYLLTQADLDAAMVTNDASASANSSVGFATATDSLTIYTYNGLHLYLTAAPAYWQELGDVITYTLILTNVGTGPVNGPYDLLPPGTNKVDISTLDCQNATDPLPLYASTQCTATWTVKNPDPSNPTINATAQFSAEGGAVESNKAGVDVPKYNCGSTVLYSDVATPNPDGSDVIWNITNDTGLDVDISDMTVTWNVAPPDLTQVLLGGVSIWSGGTSAVTSFSLPNPPWTLPTGTATPLEVQFYNGVPSTINVALSFGGITCSSNPMNLPYP
jgi:uncharacterized repeat protein (TIGR01451 family)